MAEGDSCPWCGSRCEAEWYAQREGQAGEWKAACCGALLLAMTHDNGWQASVSFDLIEPAPEEATA